LKTLAINQGQPWAPIENNVNNYATLITQAFNADEVINDTRFFSANGYDNGFVRGAVSTGNNRVVDMLSALGTWLVDTQVPNRWNAANASLNPIVNPILAAVGAQLSFNYNGCRGSGCFL
jgi:hypothetical protein